MFTIKSPKTLPPKLLSLKNKGKKIGFVPTMGYLHDGHISLVRKARKECDVVVVSMFVNPTQFGPNEDFKKYPRDTKKDKIILLKEKVDYLFLPSKETMYRKKHSVYVEEHRMTKILCGKFRPGHFRGVLTIVAKLFQIVQPSRAYFGQKDLQQAYLISKMVDDLNMPVQIIICPIIREESGLAMSSRNTYLSESEKHRALSIRKGLDQVITLVKKGRKDITLLKKEGSKTVKKGCDNLQYFEIIELPNFTMPRRIEKGKRYAVLCAAFVSQTRLIDNRIFKG